MSLLERIEKLRAEVAELMKLPDSTPTFSKEEATAIHAEANRLREDAEQLAGKLDIDASNAALYRDYFRDNVEGEDLEADDGLVCVSVSSEGAFVHCWAWVPAGDVGIEVEVEGN